MEGGFMRPMVNVKAYILVIVTVPFLYGSCNWVALATGHPLV